MKKTDMLTIGEVARRAGLRASAVRYYEQIGLVPAPDRVSGQRRYAPGSVARLRLIQAAQQTGFTLKEIGQLLDGFSQDTPPSLRWQTLARAKLPQVEALIVRATEMKALLQAGSRCECIDLEQCFGVNEGCVATQRS